MKRGAGGASIRVGSSIRDYTVWSLQKYATDINNTSTTTSTTSTTTKTISILVLILLLLLLLQLLVLCLDTT